MKQLQFGKNTYSFPNTWDELTPAQYINLCGHLSQHLKGKISVEKCKALWFCDMAGIKFSSKDKKNDLLWENLYLVSSEFTFMFMIEYEQKLDKLPLELRKALRRRLPADLYLYRDEPMLRWVEKLQYRFIPDLCFLVNLVPIIKTNHRSYYGYRLQHNKSVFTTSLKAHQFINAITAYDAYNKKQDTDFIHLLISILYSNGQNPDAFKDLDPAIKTAVFYNFEAVLRFIMSKTRYSLIWGGKPDTSKKQKLELGLSESIYNLAKSGYGNIEELEKINLVQYLDLLLKNITDSVKMLNDAGLELTEIANKTNLTIDQVSKII